MADRTITVRQIASPMRRRGDQRQTLIGLGLNRIGRVARLPDTPATRGMIAKVHHLVQVLEQAMEPGRDRRATAPSGGKR